MTSGLQSTITDPAGLTGPQRDAMFGLLADCYDCVTRAAFDKDLAGKTSVILLHDTDDRLRGFSTQQLHDHCWHGETVRILFSGDTIIDPACWGSPELPKAWCRLAARTLRAQPGRRLFWFLISKGYRTYLFLPLFFRQFLPSPEAEAPQEWQDLLNQLAAARFGNCYNPATGLIRFPESRGQLTPGLAAVPAARLEDPGVQFFLQQNPDYACGDELACLAEITPGNTRGPGKRWLTRALEESASPAAETGPVRVPPRPAREFRATTANTLWQAICEPARRRLARALTEPAAAQAATLGRILTQQRNTAFARRHSLHPDMSPEEFRRAVPVAGYSAHRPDITRMMAGEPDILSAGRPDAFERSSGSTAAAKYIPLTPALRAEFSEAVRAWIGDLLQRHPGVRHGPAWWVISPLRHPREITSGGIPVGLTSDEEYLGRWERRMASWLHAVPPAVARLTDLNENLDWTLRFLLQRPGLRLISVWNPSYLTLLWQRFLENSDRFLTLLSEGSGPGTAPSLQPHLRALPDHAAALRRIRNPVPQDVWPHLAVISGWADGEAGSAADTVRALFPHACYQPKGLLATEGVITVPWEDDCAAGVPALHSHFLEFLESPGDCPRLVHELEPDRDYAVVLTTGGGLWRYPLGDLVRVDGRAGATPRLRFAGRCDDVCDLRGEKLHPEFVRNALSGLGGGFRLLAPCRETDPPHYILFTTDPDISDVSVERALAANPHYAHAREAGQLAPLRIFQVRNPDPSSVFIDHCVSLGQRAGTVKPVALHRASGWETCFDGRFA